MGGIIFQIVVSALYKPGLGECFHFNSTGVSDERLQQQPTLITTVRAKSRLCDTMYNTDMILYLRHVFD